MPTAQWYLIQYDIRCKKRLVRVYRTLSSCAYALQRSVFAWYGTAEALNALQQQLSNIINAKEDDIRGYRIKNPLLLFGQSCFVDGAYFAGFPPHQHLALSALTEPSHAISHFS